MKLSLCLKKPAATCYEILMLVFTKTSLCRKHKKRRKVLSKNTFLVFIFLDSTKRKKSQRKIFKIIFSSDEQLTVLFASSRSCKSFRFKYSMATPRRRLLYETPGRNPSYHSITKLADELIAEISFVSGESFASLGGD